MRELPAQLIRKKRDGEELHEGEIRDLVSGIVDGSLNDAQLGALLMAGVLRTSTAGEIAHWTRAMRDSGRVYDLSGVPGTKVDKHSTGGVGDKVSLVLAPLVAACGVKVPMISGRGLGHTGGTVDKLESIAGFRMDLSPAEFVEILADIGVAMSSATADVAPADRRMYAVRDVTATVESIPWITSSILSKKLAEGIDALVLDVKCGRGAFMRDLASARELASSLVETAARLGCRARARITDMDRPLGRAVGNALEVAEAIECLRGGGPDDLRECVLLLAADMLVFGGAATDDAAARRTAAGALDSGRALDKLRALVERQGGRAGVVDDPSRLPRAPVVREVPSQRGGTLRDLDPMAVGMAALRLGAGRRRQDEDVDPAAGVMCVCKPGEPLDAGDPVFRVHARSDADAERAAVELAAAFDVGDTPPESPLLLATIDA